MALRITLAAVGRLRQSPEAVLTADYLLRMTKSGKSLGIGPAALVEVEDRSNGGPSPEASLLKTAVPPAATLVALDERGTALSSVAISNAIARWRDDGIRDVAFILGGANGLAPALRSERRLKQPHSSDGHAAR